ncbi:MAG: hypothetical protein WCO60_17675 [Verrucomicrobiota bacterium]
MKVGAFDLDMDDGEIRFHASSVSPEGRLEDSVIGRLLSVSLILADRYYPAFMAVLFGNQSPEEALLKLEMEEE